MFGNVHVLRKETIQITIIIQINNNGVLYDMKAFLVYFIRFMLQVKQEHAGKHVLADRGPYMTIYGMVITLKHN